jgi:hypothetical protein
MRRSSRRRTITLFIAFIVLVTGFLLRSRLAHAGVAAITRKLVWTATGDDGLAGRAARYDLRYSASTISGTDTLKWWNAATKVDMTGKVPAASGKRDSTLIAGLSTAVRYYAIIRVADEVPNWGRYSNVATIYPVATPVEPVGVAPALVVGAPRPSPTSGRAEIDLALGRGGRVTADVFDLHGRHVRSIHSGSMEAGQHVIRWDGRTRSGGPAASGVYWVRVRAERLQETVQLIVVR